MSPPHFDCLPFAALLLLGVGFGAAFVEGAGVALVEAFAWGRGVWVTTRVGDCVTSNWTSAGVEP